MLHSKIGLHTELSAFLDREWFLLELFNATGGSQVDHEVRTSGNFEGEGCDYTFSFVGGVHGERFACSAKAEGGFPSVEGFIVLI